MDINGSARFRHRKTPSTDRFLGAYPRTSQEPSSASVNTANDNFIEENELNEDDIFSTGDFSESSNNHHHNQNHFHNSPPSSTASPRQHLKTAFSQQDSFGILAALPEHKINSHSHLYQKTAISSPSSSTSSSSTTSSSRFIPTIPKPPQERLPIYSSSFSGKFHTHPQSAPVNVPMMAMAMRSRKHKEFDEIDEDEEEGDGEMLPPHEMVARQQSPLVACSVLEGVGRTLKGRDLRQEKESLRIFSGT
ncbi:protein S40-7 isoform X2 [Mercurialis annua]|uniref:protein S40-7 isoform X2 n=1 Tax=Mercurialis annua TaxID=3986 RepID=UPI00215EA819|nr:protein S40-7 isoform X2 [Mercurialis annua]